VPVHPDVLHVMGTVVTVDIRDSSRTDALVERVFAWFREVDDRFSAWKPGSEVSRYARGELQDPQLSTDLREVLVACEQVRVLSRGAFDIRHHRPDGQPDPTGLVKGWSVDRAVTMLEEAGATDFNVNAGGDAVVRGHPEPGRTWRVGIQHPAIRDRLAGVVSGTDFAVATSGTYERGEHILDPLAGAPPTGLVSMTVIGPMLSLADAYATAAFVMGATEGLGWLDGIPDYSGCAVTDDERLMWTPGFDRYLET
jgi:thiamine biosynthesis lipoprotein